MTNTVDCARITSGHKEDDTTEVAVEHVLTKPMSQYVGTEGLLWCSRKWPMRTLPNAESAGLLMTTGSRRGLPRFMVLDVLKTTLTLLTGLVKQYEETTSSFFFHVIYAPLNITDQ